MKTGKAILDNTFGDSKYFYFMMMFVAMIFWGIAWPVGKVAASHSTPEVAAFWRYAISFLSFLPIFYFLSPSLKTNREGLMITIFAALFTSVFNWLFFVGLTHGLAGYGGTIVTTMSPIITYFLSMLVFKVTIGKPQALALFLGILGGAIMLKIPWDAEKLLDIGVAYFVAAAFVWSIVTIFTQRAIKQMNWILFTALVFGITAFVNMLSALPYHPFSIELYDAVFWETIIFIGLIPGTFSTATFFLSSGKLGAHNTAVYMFIVPIGAIVSSYFIFGEIPTLPTIIGCAVTFLAVLIFNFAPKKGKI